MPPGPCTGALAILTLLLVPFAASAQDAPAPAPDPSPNYSHQPRTIPAPEGPQGAFPPPPPRGAGRTLNAAISAGPGWLALRDDLGRDAQQATSLTARVGVVMGPEWNLVLGLDHARTRRGGATFSQTAGLFGVQRFFFKRVYLGAAVGMAFVKESDVPNGITDGPGGTLSAHLGVEAVRLRHAALTVEAGFTIAEYNEEKWEMAGARLGVVLF
jgi:hypothetical protein